MADASDPSAPNNSTTITDPADARAYLNTLSSHVLRLGDTSYLHPDFAVKMANAVSQARAAGLPVTLQSGYRTNNTTGSAYDASGLSLHGYGAAADVGGIGPASSPQAKQWAQIASANGLSNPYGVDNPKEFNHWQLVPWKLENRPDIQAKLASAGGDLGKVWNAIEPVGDSSSSTMALNGAKPLTAPASAAIGNATTPKLPASDPLADYAPTATGAPSLLAKPAAAAPAPPSADPLADYTTAPQTGAEPYPGPPSFSELSTAAAGNPNNIDTTKPPATRFFGLLRAEPDYSTPAPVAPISNYLMGQAKGAIAEVPQDFGQGLAAAARGVQDVAQGNALPSFPSVDPRTWSAGGALTTAGGLAGAAFSPLTAATNKLVSEPVNLLTGGPQTVQETNLFGTPTGNSITYDPGERAGLVANLLAGGGLGTKAAEAGAAITPTARAAAGFRSLLGDTPPPELVNRFAQNPDLRLMDDPRARAILQGAATTPGTKAFNILSKSAEESDAAAPSAVSGAFDKAMGPTPNVQKLLADLDQKTRDNAKKAYGDAFADAKPVDVSPVVDMLSKIETPGVNSVVSMPSGIPPSVRQQTATNLKSLLTDENGSVLTDPVRLGEIQSDLRKQAQAESARGGMTSDILTNTRNAINTAMDAATGGKYSAARLQYRNDMAVPEAFQTGVDALGGTGVEDRPEFLQAWKDAPERTPEEIQAAQLGMRTAADNLINGRRFSARNGQNVGEVPFNVQKMNILLGPGEGDALAEKLAASKDIATTNNLLFGGSKTALAQAAQRSSGGASNLLTAASTALPALGAFSGGAGVVNSALLGAGGYLVRKGAQAADAAHNTATARLAVMPGSEALRAIYGAKPPSVLDNLLTRGGAAGAASIGARNKLVNPSASANP